MQQVVSAPWTPKNDTEVAGLRISKKFLTNPGMHVSY